MELTKMTVHLPEELLEQARRFSRENDTNLNQLINAFLERVVAGHEPPPDRPALPRLVSFLPPAVVEEYYSYLDEKYSRVA